MSEDYQKFLQEADFDQSELVAIETMDPIIRELEKIEPAQFPTRRSFLQAKIALQNSLRISVKTIKDIDLQRIAAGILPSENPQGSKIHPQVATPSLENLSPPELPASPPRPLPPVFPLIIPQIGELFPDLHPPVPKKRLVNESTLPPTKRTNKQTDESSESANQEGVLFYSKMALTKKKDGSYTIEEADLAHEPTSVLVETALSKKDLSKIELWLTFKIILNPTLMTFIKVEKTLYQRLLLLAKKRQLASQLVKKAIDGFCLLCQSTKTIGYKVFDGKGEIGSVGWCCWSRFSMAVNCCDYLAWLKTRVLTTPEENSKQLENARRQLDAIIYNAEMFHKHTEKEAEKQ